MPHLAHKKEYKKCINCGLLIEKPQNESRYNWENRRKYCSKECAKGLLFYKGMKSWNKGTKGVIKSWNKGKTMESDSRIKQPWLGKKRSKETIEKIRAKTTGVKRPLTKEKSEALSNRMKGNRFASRIVPPEERVRRSKIIKEVIKTKGWHLYKGGITPFRKGLRSSLEYKMWRESIFKRDDYTCQMCRVRGTTLHVDHINKFSTILDKNGIDSLEKALNCAELWDIKNGRTLCKKCHKERHMVDSIYK